MYAIVESDIDLRGPEVTTEDGESLRVKWPAGIEMFLSADEARALVDALTVALAGA